MLPQKADHSLACLRLFRPPAKIILPCPRQYNLKWRGLFSLCFGIMCFARHQTGSLNAWVLPVLLRNRPNKIIFEWRVTTVICLFSYTMSKTWRVLFCICSLIEICAFWFNPLCPGVTNSSHQNFDFKIRRVHKKNFLWASRLWVGRWKEPILGYVPKKEFRQ